MPKPDWKKRLKAWRTYGWLKPKKPIDDRVRARLHNLNDTDLAAIARNPMHSEAAQQEAEAQLLRRGGRLNLADVYVPGFVKPAPYDKIKRKFFGFSREVRKWMGILTLLLFIGLFGMAGWSVELEDKALKEAREAGVITDDEYFDRGRKLTKAEIEAADPDVLETFPSDTRLENILLKRAEATPAGKRRKQVEIGAYTLVGALIIVFLIWSTFTLLRRQPARVLLLRKFNNKKLGKAMSNVITTELRPFGHVMTLSDKHIRRSKLAFLGNAIPTSIPHAILIVFWLPLRIVMRQFNRAKHGPVWVGSARNFRSLAQRLRDRMGLNLEVAWTKKEAFIVRTSDDWWKEVIALLMHASDVIVVDLSEVTSGTQWELERLDALGTWRDAVFIAHEDKEGAAAAALSEFEWEDPDLFLYDKLGDMHDQALFRSTMLDIITHSANARAGAFKPSQPKGAPLIEGAPRHQGSAPLAE